MQRHLSPFFLGAALSFTWVATGCSSPPATQAGAQAVPVSLETLKAGTVKESTEFVGNLEAVQITELDSRKFSVV